ncbi:MAG: molybdopterin-dependent oxidoreductase [Ignavibacteriae bacterium]|nr:molybdopterin-dependent oxidoreductase [Ignavibacteriota bacterium]
MNSLSRRKFLKITGATAGLVVAGSTLGGLVKKSNAYIDKKYENGKGVKKIPTFCDLCFWKCGSIAYVKNGELWKIEGNPEDPLSRGRLCPRGTGGPGAFRDPDRLKSPLIRKTERGQEQWVEVTWDEALSYIADKMNRIKTSFGPESMAYFVHGIGGNFIKHMMKAYGTPNISAPSFAQCRGPRDIGFRLTFGEDVGSPERMDIQNAKCLVLIGSHLGENMHNTQVQEFAEMNGAGGSIIVVDPRFSVAAGKAKYYLPIKPGTDIALLLAWMKVIVDENLFDKDYVDKYGFGFEQFKAEIQQYTPEWAYTETGIEPELIRTSAREMAKHKPATLIHSGRHTTWYGDDTQRSRAIALLNALMGSWGRKGGYYYPASMSVPNYPYPPYPKPEKGKVDNPGNTIYPFATEGHDTITNGVREATITGKPYPIKGWITYGTNLLYAMPNQDETLKAIQNLDLLVVVDVVPTELAGWADVVLPESVYLERFDDINVEFFKEPFVALRQPVMDSPNEQKPNWWIAKKLADKLGLGHYFPWNDIEEYIKYRMTAAGLSYDELKKKGIIKGAKQPIFFNEGINPEFPTPSGKIEFYSLQLAGLGHDPVPKFKKHKEPPPGFFRLIFGRSPVHTFSKTQNNKLLTEMQDENELWLNINIAKRLGVKSGDYVKLKNQDGVVSNKIKVKATERIRQDCVYMTHGFGHTSKKLRQAFLKGASDSQMITQYTVDPLMGGTGMNVNFVTLEL